MDDWNWRVLNIWSARYKYIQQATFDIYSFKITQDSSIIVSAYLNAVAAQYCVLTVTIDDDDVKKS